MRIKKLRYWVNIFFTVFAALALTIAGLAVWFSYKQAQAYIHPARLRVATGLLDANQIQYQEIELTAEDGTKLAAWVTPSQNGALILVAHGHGACRSQEMYALFASHGYGVLAWDFRAHGESGGEFTSLGYYEVMDAKAALDYALAQPNVNHIGAWGGSMGGVTMIRAAAEYPQIEALVSDSAFSTLKDELNLRVPYPVINPLIKFFAEQQTGLSLDSVRAVDDIRSISPRPVFIIQSSNDKVVPLDSALRLYENAGAPKELWVKDRAHHLEMNAFYPEEYAEKVISFFDMYLK
jgi:fermentation-respiration switch protein FrsA (DUF1100 family)